MAHISVVDAQNEHVSDGVDVDQIPAVRARCLDASNEFSAKVADMGMT